MDHYQNATSLIFIPYIINMAFAKNHSHVSGRFAARKERIYNSKKRAPRAFTGALLFWDLRIIYVQAPRLREVNTKSFPAEQLLLALVALAAALRAADRSRSDRFCEGGGRLFVRGQGT